MATIIDLGKKVKAKYPEYNDLSDYEVGRRVKAKYQEYNDFEDVSPMSFDVPKPEIPQEQRQQTLQQKEVELKKEADKGVLGQIPAAFAQQAKNLPFVGGAIRLGGILKNAINSKSDAKSAGETVTSNNQQLQLLRKGIADLEAQGKDATKTKQAYNDLLAKTDIASQQIDTVRANIPTNSQAAGALVQTGLDVLTAGTFKPKPANIPSVISAVTKPTSGFLPKVAKIATGAGVGYGYDTSLGLQGDRGEDRAGKNAFIPGVGTAIGAIAPTITETLGAVKRPDSAKIMQRVARISKGKQAKFEKTAGESVGEYLVKRDIYGDQDQVAQKLYDRFQTSKGVADDALASIQGTYRAKQVDTALDELIAREARVSSPGAPSKDLARVNTLFNKNKGEGLTMSEINEVKRLYERNNKLDYLKQNLPESVARANNIDNAIREWQFAQARKAGLQNLPEINRETRLAKQLLDDLGAESAGSAGNNAVTLTDWIALSGGDPTSISLFLGKKTLGNKKIQSSIAQSRFAKKPSDKVGIPTARFDERLALPAPKTGSPRVSIETPINLPRKLESRIETAESVRRNFANIKTRVPQLPLLPAPSGRPNFNAANPDAIVSLPVNRRIEYTGSKNVIGKSKPANLPKRGKVTRLPSILFDEPYIPNDKLPVIRFGRRKRK